MENIVERIELILRAKNLSPSKFADEIGIQRSGMSHIMSGRNKPSLDFIMKIMDRFKEINASWLLQGHGPMTDDGEPEIAAELKQPVSYEKQEMTAGLIEGGKKLMKSGHKIDRIIIFYNDQTFSTFSPGE